ncbi:hypothetical protein [Antribacter gilvus]|uniref:hypothetical protein n=1 Tax=Antribacter gilvus TaxID=2304675 RepID=UPI000F7AB439|nr:hypothetical protein [Antribacter gilvus]
MSITFIGENRTGRLTCGTEHLPGCYNPGINLTACICGQVWWVGQVGTWHSTARREPAPAMPTLGVGIGAPGLREADRKLLGWDTYYFHADDCPNRDARKPCHPCGGSEPTDYHTAAKAARGEAS